MLVERRGPYALDNERLVLRVPWKKTSMKRRRQIVVPPSLQIQDRRPIRAETRATLVASIARGRRWLDEIVAGVVTGEHRYSLRQLLLRRREYPEIAFAPGVSGKQLHRLRTCGVLPIASVGGEHVQGCVSAQACSPACDELIDKGAFITAE
jgi:hypothetical protein